LNPAGRAEHIGSAWFFVAAVAGEVHARLHKAWAP
jgi:hypothetical protein